MSAKQKAVYQKEFGPLYQLSGAVRLLQLKSETEGREYKGSTLEETKEMMKKLGVELNDRKIKEVLRQAQNIEQIKVYYDFDKKRRLLRPYKTDTIDVLLKNLGFVEIIPEEVKLKVEL